MIHFDSVSKRYTSGHEALRDVSFQVVAGEMIFVTGHSGAGKSTLLKLIAHMEQPTRGQVVIGGRNTAKLTTRQIPEFRRRMGVVFQENRFLHHRSVFDNVALPLVVRGAPAADIKRRTQAALDKVGLLSRAQVRPITLSGGEQQRVGIARAIVHRPDILLADEPTGNLDPDLADTVMDLFAEFSQYGVAVLVATHDKRHIERLRKRVLLLQDGGLLEDRPGPNP